MSVVHVHEKLNPTVGVAGILPLPGIGRGAKGIPMGRRAALVSSVIILLITSTVLTACVEISPPVGQPDQVATTLAADDPLAVISPLPDYVSNGTWWTLDGSDSQGVIVSYLWNVTVEGVTTFLHSMSEIYRFQTLGLYKITLTVTDNRSMESTAFTAVVSVLDSDSDTLPDWWEVKHFGDLNETASGDFDRDKYDNLEEYAKGTDPEVKDPRPTFFQMVKDNWTVVALLAALLVGAALLLYPFVNRRRKKKEKQKIAAAIAIEKALEGEDE